MHAEIFRAYDIRGVVDITLTTEITYKIAKAISTMIIDSQYDSVIAIARDGRLSGSKLMQALKDGFMESGIDIIDLGQIPTPALYFSCHFYNISNGIMITGSHNPPDYNGLKMIIGGQAIYGDTIQALFQFIKNNQFVKKSMSSQESRIDCIRDYIDKIVSICTLNRPLKIVVDAGNGVAGPIAQTLYQCLGATVIPLYCEIDGLFPNHHPDPGDPKNLIELQQQVISQNADLGLAFDGDGDRLGIIDDQGKIIWPDRVLMAFAKDILQRNQNRMIIYDIKSTSLLKQQITQYQGIPLMWKTGHSLIKAKMKETHAILAGEMSGHFFFQEKWYGFDDGLYAGARLMEILSRVDAKSSAFFQSFPELVSTPEIGIRVTEETKFQIIDKMKQSKVFPKNGEISYLDGLRIDYEKAWGLLRASNTNPMLIARFEGQNQSSLDWIQGLFWKALKEIQL